VHVACIGRMRNSCLILVGKPKEREHLLDLAVDGRILPFDLNDICCKGVD
jgi:hypothetical protein